MFIIIIICLSLTISVYHNMFIFEMAEGSHRASSSPKTCEVCRCQHRQEGNSGGKDKRQQTKRNNKMEQHHHENMETWWWQNDTCHQHWKWQQGASGHAFGLHFHFIYTNDLSFRPFEVIRYSVIHNIMIQQREAGNYSRLQEILDNLDKMWFGVAK